MLRFDSAASDAGGPLICLAVDLASIILGHGPRGLRPSLSLQDIFPSESRSSAQGTWRRIAQAFPRFLDVQHVWCRYWVCFGVLASRTFVRRQRQEVEPYNTVLCVALLCLSTRTSQSCWTTRRYKVLGGKLHRPSQGFLMYNACTGSVFGYLLLER